MMRLVSARWALLLFLLPIMMLSLAGCSSDDPVTPNEELELTSADVASQAGFITYALANILQDFSKTSVVNMYGPLIGSYMRDVNGADTHYYTEADQDLHWSPEGFSTTVSVTFDITLTGGTPKAADGYGDFHAGTLAIRFEVNNVQLDVNRRPVDGSMLVTSGRFAANVMFGNNTATVQIGTESWTVDMTTGLLV